MKAKIPKGFRDIFSGDLRARRTMLETIRRVYERYGFAPLETPCLEYAEVLGKFLPESETPDGGVFFTRDEGDRRLALRYDLTAPLSRVVAQYAQHLPMPFRRYQFGLVWRREKPGPGRFREFFQTDFDTVGAASPAADVEVCMVLADCLEELGIPRGDYQISVNNRKILNGLLEKIGVPFGEPGGGVDTALRVLRSIDKLDRLGISGVEELLAKGRRDESGDFTPGAGLDGKKIDLILSYLNISGETRGKVLEGLQAVVSGNRTGEEGVGELEEIHRQLDAMGFGEDRVAFNPCAVRGLEYYTGAVFEALLSFQVEDEKGASRSLGSVAGGGRYDGLVARFTGSPLPATGASIGVDRLLEALKVLGKIRSEDTPGPVVVAVLDRERITEYQKMAFELRAAGVAAEVYLGEKKLGGQLKYADRRASPAVIIAGEEEFEQNQVSIKDLNLGARLAGDVRDREAWRKGQPAQVRVPRDEMVKKIQAILKPQ